MIVRNVGYMKYSEVLWKLKQHSTFGIYKTHKNTNILVFGIPRTQIELFRPKSETEYGIFEGEKIISGILIFSSTDRPHKNIDLTNWNMGSQIIAYEEFEK